MPQKLSAEDKRRISHLRTRLGTIAERYSQAEIARRTGVSRSNVSRYLSGTRMPADFSMALAEKLNVNPDWLLKGSGAPWLEDVPTNTAAVASDLLDLIRSMAAVEHMQIGALAGKNRLKQLRELSDAMNRFESLREQLNKRSAPVLAAVLEELRSALSKPDFDRAEELSRTAEQVGRLCDDPTLTLELALLHGKYRTMIGRSDEALRLNRRVAPLVLHHEGGVGGKELEALAVSVAALTYAARTDEALRTAQAGLMLAPPEVHGTLGGCRVRQEFAHLQLMTGHVRPAHLALTELIDTLPGADGDRTRAMLTQSMLMMGMIDVRTAIRLKDDSPWSAVYILAFTTISEHEEDLVNALDYWDRAHRFRNQGDGPSLRQWAWLLLRALRGEGAPVETELREYMEVKLASKPPIDFRSITAAQICRRLGLDAQARQWLKKSERVIVGLPPFLHVPLNWQARHFRNALELGGKAQQREAQQFFRRHVDRGYRCFIPLVGGAGAGGTNGVEAG